MSHRKPPVVIKPPLDGETFDRIHADAEDKIARALRPQIEAFAVDDLPVTGRVVLFVHITDVAALLQINRAADRQRQNQQRKPEKQFPIAVY